MCFAFSTLHSPLSTLPSALSPDQTSANLSPPELTGQNSTRCRCSQQLLIGDCSLTAAAAATAGAAAKLSVKQVKAKDDSEHSASCQDGGRKLHFKWSRSTNYVHTDHFVLIPQNVAVLCAGCHASLTKTHTDTHTHMHMARHPQSSMSFRSLGNLATPAP